MNSKQTSNHSASPPTITVARGVIPHIEPNNALLPSEQEKRLFEMEKSKERQAVINQVINDQNCSERFSCKKS